MTPTCWRPNLAAEDADEYPRHRDDRHEPLLPRLFLAIDATIGPSAKVGLSDYFKSAPDWTNSGTIALFSAPPPETRVTTPACATGPQKC